ncbi:MAG: HAMP domain-containing histidine kinase [Oscillospiraceae bacterium]|nr:HAMP domain-containing histidine kinase [Oscillospiraceae bacterium]
MTDRKKPKRRFAYEILGLIGISALFAGILFLILSWTAATIAESYCFYNDVVMTEFDWLEVDRWIFSLSGILCAGCFSLLFLSLLSDRMAYIRTLTQGIDTLRLGQAGNILPLEGRNELTQLADAINYMSATQQQLREKEQTLAREKEQFLRALSHDIRTPLTSILAYSEFLAEGNSLSPAEQKQHLQTIRRKAEQIRDLTALLLDGNKRNPEHFDDAHLLMEQLAAELEEELEEAFTVHTDLSGCPSFSGAFDVQELHRIFDNLSSNVQKYADPQQPVDLSIWTTPAGLCIRQTNHISAEAGQKDSSKLGINSIRRIAQNYGGKVDVLQNTEQFSICITLSDF